MFEGEVMNIEFLHPILFLPKAWMRRGRHENIGHVLVLPKFIVPSPEGFCLVGSDLHFAFYSSGSVDDIFAVFFPLWE